MIFSIFRRWCNHHHHLNSEHFFYPHRRTFFSLLFRKTGRWREKHHSEREASVWLPPVCTWIRDWTCTLSVTGRQSGHWATPAGITSEHSRYPQKRPCTSKQTLPSPPPPGATSTPSLISASMDSSILIHSFLTSTYIILFKILVFQIIQITIRNILQLKYILH